MDLILFGVLDALFDLDLLMKVTKSARDYKKVWGRKKTEVKRSTSKKNVTRFSGLSLLTVSTLAKLLFGDASIEIVRYRRIIHIKVAQFQSFIRLSTPSRLIMLLYTICAENSAGIGIKLEGRNAQKRPFFVFTHFFTHFQK